MTRNEILARVFMRKDSIIHGNRKPIHDIWNRITLCDTCHDAVHGKCEVEFMGKVLRGWMLMLAILDKWKLSVEYRWAEVYEHAKTQAEKQEGRMK